MEEITLCLAVDTYDRIVDLMNKYGHSDLSVERFVENLLIEKVYVDENV